jgi:uncharacterized protein
MRWAESIVPSSANAAFWEGLRSGRLLAAHCAGCDRWSFYPRAVCPHCGALHPALEPLRGEGEVYSVTTVRRPLFEDWGDEPYDVALVDMVEGVRVMGRVVARAGTVSIGDPVRVTFVEIEGERHWYAFAPIEERPR